MSLGYRKLSLGFNRASSKPKSPLAGAVLRFDAREGVAVDGSNFLTGWTDQVSGVVTNTLTGQQAPLFEAAGFNGQPTLAFNNTRMIEAALALPINAATLIVVGQINTNTEANGRVAALIRKSANGDWNDSANLKIERNSTTDLFYAAKGSGGSTGQQTMTYDTPRVLIAVANGGDLVFSLSGTESTGTGAAGDLTLAQKLFVGGGWNTSAGGFRLTGKVSEVIVIPRALTAGERATVLAELKASWSLA